MTNCYPVTIGISYQHHVMSNAGGSVVLVGEYGFCTEESDKNGKKLRVTFDGGMNWSVINNITVDMGSSDPPYHAYNRHFHAAIYDPLTGRIWSSKGDVYNAKFEYSDDFGANWHQVAIDQYPVDPQPTLMIAFPKNLIYFPDTAAQEGQGIRSSVAMWEMYRDNKAHDMGADKFYAEPSHCVLNNKVCYDYYGYGPYAQNGIEAYVVLPNMVQRGGSNAYILGTGDDGESWHMLYHNAHSIIYGIVGLDRNGKLIMACNGGMQGVSPGYAVADPVERVYK